MASMMQAQRENRRTTSKPLGGTEEQEGSWNEAFAALAACHCNGAFQNCGSGRDGGTYTAVPQESAGVDGQEARPLQNDCDGLYNIFAGHPILSSMLGSLPLGFISFYQEWAAYYIFIFNFLAIVPLAWLIGKATEDGAAKLGPVAGGLMNATFGNVVEMLLCISGIRNGEIAVVQCTLLGSILSNLLLVMGCAFLAGGMMYPTQKYNQAGASTQCSLLAMSVLAIGLPTMYCNILKQESEWEHMLEVSRWSSVCLFLVYIAYLIFQLWTHAEFFQDAEGGGDEEEPDLSPGTAFIVLGLATMVTAAATDNLISSIRGTVDSWSVSKEFIGIILLPIIGNAAEHYTAITVAMRNKMDLSLGVAAGSSCQMALLVTPWAVWVGWYYDTDMSLNFHAFQLAVLLLSVMLVTSILNNGQSNWLEGFMLLVTYLVLSLIYFFEGAGEDSSLTTVY